MSASTSIFLFVLIFRDDLFGRPGEPSCQSTFAISIDSSLQTLTDLNDYITPSQACIKPVEHTNAPKVRTPGDAAVCADCHPRDPRVTN